MRNSYLFEVRAWLLTFPFILLVTSLFLIFHLVFVVTHRASHTAYLYALALANYSLLLALRLIGTSFDVEVSSSPSSECGVIFVCNHQSLVDIPLLSWHLRRYHPKFVAKRELGRGIPAVSHALRNTGAALIDRSDRSAAIQQIREFGAQLREQNLAAVIFPEGTRARNGRLKPFKTAGLTALLESMPGAPVVPIVIQGTWKITEKNLLPVQPGVEVKLRSGAPIHNRDGDINALLLEIENFFREALLPA